MLRSMTLTRGCLRAFHTSQMAQAAKKASPSFNAASAAERLGVKFQTPSILEQALTHRSFENTKVPCNTRLAYLGRRALDLFAEESSATNAVTPERLAVQFDKLNLEEGLQYSHGPETKNIKIKASALQALVGAVYHEQGMEAARKFASQHALGN
ncbi:ribonuclease III domain-containing protein [Syncephalastrum racemosum]|uniref:Ribonuclease III domain-containing protein n=1 Tax=Syncephalastrum racemosum TaxID=13706 RepID=A0A1X2HKW0_SYNRA|nr:ribonuclease III domain-containing protein [Syncephalastrum racemosum]